jgi:flagellar motor switch protein FliN/FliY
LGTGHHVHLELDAGTAGVQRRHLLAVMSPTADAPVAGPPVVAHPFTYSQLGAPAPAAPRQERDFDPILDVSLQVRVELGSTRMTVEEVLAISPGSIVELDRLAGEPVDIVVNDRLIARGEVVVVEENFGVRVTDIITQRPAAP